MVVTPSNIPSLFIAGEELSMSILLQNTGNVKLTNLQVTASEYNDELAILWPELDASEYNDEFAILWPELDAGGFVAVTVSTYTKSMSQAFIDVLAWSNTATVEVRKNTHPME